MHAQPIRTIARDLGIGPGNLDRGSLLRTIRIFKGNFDCFGTAHEGVRDRIGRAWRDDRFALANGGRLHAN